VHETRALTSPLGVCERMPPLASSPSMSIVFAVMFGPGLYGPAQVGCLGSGIGTQALARLRACSGRSAFASRSARHAPEPRARSRHNWGRVA
jgi:hypothetical protein